MVNSVSPASAYGELAAESGLKLCGQVTVAAVVDKMGEEAFVKADVSAAVKTECARCTEPFELPFNAAFEALYVPDFPPDAVGSRSARAEEESQQVLYYSGGVVDLAQQIIEALALAVPIKPLCRDDCKGLCPNCGRNLNEGQCDCPKDDGFGKPFKGLFGSG